MNLASLLPRHALRRQIWRFALVGFANVGVDLALYSSLMALGAGIVVSKGVAYLGCTLFAFVLIRNWTFDSRDIGLGRIVPFVVLYSTSLGLNVFVNTAVVGVAGRSGIGLTIAFIAAVGAPAPLNFIGMHLLFGGHARTAEQGPPADMASLRKSRAREALTVLANSVQFRGANAGLGRKAAASAASWRRNERAGVAAERRIVADRRGQPAHHPQSRKISCA